MKDELPSVPQYLREKEAARGCRPNIQVLYDGEGRRLDPHEAAMAEHDDRPLPLLSLDYPVSVFVTLVVAAVSLVTLFGHLAGRW
jgi:hypothetical protein